MKLLILKRIFFVTGTLSACAGTGGTHAAANLHLRTNTVGSNIVVVDSHHKFYGIVCLQSLIGESRADLVFPKIKGYVGVETYRSSYGRSVPPELKSTYVSLDLEETNKIFSNPNGV